MKTKKCYILAMQLLWLLGFMVFVNSKVTSIIQSSHEDDHFDRLFEITTQQSPKPFYLRLSCKQKNMLSVSITKSEEFEEYPRFPLHSPLKETPRMQRKIYTFWESCNVDVKVNKNGQILQLFRKNEQTPYFSIQDFHWADDDFITIITSDKSVKWGMGERFQRSFAIKDGLWTVWNRDRPWEIDYGRADRSAQTYGHQPVYLARSKISNNFHLVYFKNTYGFNFQSKQESNQMLYYVTGGHIHFVILLGKDPESILKQYHHYIGPAMVPPFWSLGYHQSRWGYRNIEEFKQVISEFEKYQLPLDTMWSDLDYMDRKAIFTVDERNYPSAKFRSLLKTKNIHYIPLIDAGVSLADKVSIDAGKKYDVFFKSVHNQKQNYIAKVWPGRVHFVDYLHPNASKYWHEQLDRLYNLIPFSGVWLDMNEPSNFQGNEPTVEKYRIQHSQSINMMTIDVNLNHYCETCNDLKEKEVHAYFGHLTTVPTYEFLKKKNGRPFIISRSNSVGTGVYAGHWTGDNVATWDFLRLSISGNFLFQIFGIQMVGADICGFHHNTNEQLCSRWMQIGSFYPFARNHNENESISQQPYRFGNNLIETTRLSFYQRYSLLKQMYSTLVELNGTGSFYRPLFFEFSTDDEAYSQIIAETEFLIGDYLLGAPIVQEGLQQRKVYFPKGQKEEFWYQLELNKKAGVIVGSQVSIFRGGSQSTIHNPLPSPPPAFLRSGRLILTNKPSTRISDLSTSYTLIAALDSSQTPRSVGSFLAAKDFTSNEQINQCVEKGCFLEFSLYKGENNTYVLQWIFKGKSNITPFLEIANIQILESSALKESKTTIKIETREGRQTISLS